jgi:hypothetical protein
MILLDGPQWDLSIRKMNVYEDVPLALVLKATHHIPGIA